MSIQQKLQNLIQKYLDGFKIVMKEYGNKFSTRDRVVNQSSQKLEVVEKTVSKPQIDKERWKDDGGAIIESEQQEIRHD